MNPASPERITAEIRAELARRQMTRQQLATATGIAPATLQRRMLGKSDFTYQELASIASQFEMSAADLVARAERAA